MKSKTHFAHVERGNESQPFDEWSTTACGLEECESPASDNWEYVTCKRCLGKKDKHDNSIKQQVANF